MPENFFFGVSIYRRQCVIENQNPRPANKRASNRGSLLLADRKCYPPLANQGLESLRELQNVFGDSGFVSRSFNFFRCRAIYSEGNVSRNGLAEQKRFLRNIANRGSQDLERNVANLPAIDQNLSRLG